MPRQKRHQSNNDSQTTDSQATRARVASRDVNRRQRDAQVLSLRVQGYSFAAIAREVGYSEQGGAYKAWKRALADIPKPAADDAREHLRAQLEEVSRVLMAQLYKGNTRAGEALIKAQERYCKMLGLDLEPAGGAGSQMTLIALEPPVLEAL